MHLTPNSDVINRLVILIIKPTRCTNFSNLFLEKTLHVTDSSSVHHQEFFTVHTAMVSGSGRNSVPSWSCSQAVWHIPLLRVQWKTPDDGQRNCPKHIEFYSKNKFEKLVHLVGFIIRIYHDARSPERQKKKKACNCYARYDGLPPPPPTERKGHSQVHISPRCWLW